jgi:hypothetical protein
MSTPLPPVPGVASLRMITRNPVFTGGFTWYLKLTGPEGISLADITDIASTIGGTWADTLKPYIPNDSVLVEAIATDLTSDTGPRSTYDINIAGTNENTSDTSSMCLVIGRQESKRYRGGHPRTYHWPIPLGATSDPKTYYPTFAGAVLDAYTTLMDQINIYEAPSTRTAVLVNVHYVEDKEPLVDPLVLDVNALDYQARVCSQRRRLGKLPSIT